MRSVALRFTLAITAVFAISGVASGQGLLDKAKDIAKKTSIGKGVTKLGTEAQMLDATAVSLEDKNLPQIQVGQLKLGIASVDIKNGDAVRLHLYLYNPAQTDAAVPVPPADLFVMIDEKGRKLEMLGTPSVKNLVAGATDINVPAMERVEINVLYGSIMTDAKTGTLKVGSTGNITGIPLHTSATPPSSQSGQASSSPWKK